MEPLSSVAFVVLIVSLPILIGLGIVPYLFLWLLQWKPLRLSLKNRPILITGCDTGFGRLLAEKLAKDGIRVFAGCYSQKGVRELQDAVKTSSTAVAALTAFVMDVTDDKSVEAAKKLVESKLNSTGDKLWAIVNNAGISQGFYFEFTSMQQYRQVMEVNVFGIVRVSKAFVPLLRKSGGKTKGGRIVNIASVAGRVAAGGMSAYSVSKFGAEALSDSMRRELYPFGIKVSVIEPAFCKTNITQGVGHHAKECFIKADPSIRTAYGSEAWVDNLSLYMSNVDAISENPNRVISAIHKALSSRWPRARYSGTIIGALFFIPFSWLPAEFQDLFIATIPYYAGKYSLPGSKKSVDSDLNSAVTEDLDNSDHSNGHEHADGELLRHPLQLL